MTRYIDGITDRTALDVTNKTSKAYFNLRDWLRVYGNAQAAWALTDKLVGIPTAFVYVAFPTIASIPSATDLNTLLSNLEQIRFNIVDNGYLLTLPTFKYDWIADSHGPDYADVNIWESVLSMVVLNLGSAVGFTPVTKTAPHTTRFAKCGVGASNIGLTRANGFVKY